MPLSLRNKIEIPDDMPESRRESSLFHGASTALMRVETTSGPNLVLIDSRKLHPGELEYRGGDQNQRWVRNRGLPNSSTPASLTSGDYNGNIDGQSLVPSIE